MAKILGFGGFFFRSENPEKLAKWYEDHFGINQVPKDYDGTVWTPNAGPCVFAPFPNDTEMFGDPKKQFMLNFRVADLDAIVAELTAAGIGIAVDAETYPNGRFASLADPEGNPIQLWQQM